MEMEYSSALVQESFRVLSSPLSSSKQREEANDVLLKFQCSPKALEISFQLLGSPHMESQYLGAQVLYQKVRLEFGVSQGDHDIFSFRDLKSNKKLHAKVVERLCYSLACLGVKSFLIWDSLLSDFLNFARNESIDIGMFLLSIFPSEMDSLLLPRSHQIQLQQLMRDTADSLYPLINEVLKEDSSSQYAKHAALHCASEWIADGHWLVAHGDASLFFLGFLNQKTYATQAMELFTNYLQRNKYAKILEQASLKQAIKDYPPALSEVIVQLAFFFRDVVLPNLGNIEDDTFILKLADLALSIVSNHEIALIDETEVSSSLFETLFVFLSHPSEIVLTHCLQFWNQFRITLRELPDLGQRLFLIEKFYFMAKCLIPRLRRPLSSSANSEENIHFDEDASYLRMVSADALFSTYFLMSQYLKDEGIDQFFSLLKGAFTSQQTTDQEDYICELQVVYFVMHSILDGVDPSTKILYYYRESCLFLQRIPPNIILTKQCLLFAEEVAKYFLSEADLQEPIFSFIINSLSIRECQQAAVSTLEELVTKEIAYSAEKVKQLQEAFTSDLAESLERASLWKLSQCLVLVMKQFYSGNGSKAEEEFAEEIIAFASPFSNFVREGEGSSVLISKSIAIVASISKKVYECSSDKVSGLDVQISDKILFKIGTDLVDPVLSLLSNQQSVPDLIISSCRFIVVMSECLPSQMAQGINHILLTLLQAMNFNPKLSVIGLSLPKIIDSLGPIKSAAAKLVESFDSLVSNLIDRIKSTKDPTDVQIFSSFAAKCVLYNREAVLQSSFIEQVIQLATFCMGMFVNPEVRKALYSFWDCLACIEPDLFKPFATFAVESMLDGIKSMHSRVLFDAAIAFKDLLANQADIVIPLIEEYLARSQNFKSLDPSIVRVFVKGIVMFRNDRFKLKRILQDMQAVTDGEAKGDNFVALEVEIAMKEKKLKHL